MASKSFWLAITFEGILTSLDSDNVLAAAIAKQFWDWACGYSSRDGCR